MCLTARTSVAVSAGTGAAASLGFTFNVNAAPFVPSQSSGSEAKAAAQLPAGQKSNVHAPEFIPALSKAGAAAPPKFRWNVNAPEFIPYSQPALSQIFQGLAPASKSLTGSTAAVHCAVTTEDADHDGPPAVALHSPDDSADARAANELPVEVSQQAVAECMHGMRWLQTLHEDEVAEHWLQTVDELNADCPEGYYNPMAEAYAQGRLGLPPARGHAAATEKRCVAQERATCPDCAAVSSNKALLTVSQMVAMFAAAEGSATTASACQQPQPDEALRHAVDELLAQSVSSIFLRGPHLPTRTSRASRAKHSTARPQPQMSPGAALLHGAAAAWAVGHMATAAMALPSAAVVSPDPGQMGASGSRVIDISAHAGLQPEEPTISAFQAQPVSSAGSVASLFYYAAGAAVGIGLGLGSLIARRRV